MENIESTKPKPFYQNVMDFHNDFKTDPSFFYTTGGLMIFFVVEVSLFWLFS